MARSSRTLPTEPGLALNSEESPTEVARRARKLRASAEAKRFLEKNLSALEELARQEAGCNITSHIESLKSEYARQFNVAVNRLKENRFDVLIQILELWSQARNRIEIRLGVGLQQPPVFQRYTPTSDAPTVQEFKQQSVVNAVFSDFEESLNRDDFRSLGKSPEDLLVLAILSAIMHSRLCVKQMVFILCDFLVCRGKLSVVNSSAGRPAVVFCELTEGSGCRVGNWFDESGSLMYDFQFFPVAQTLGLISAFYASNATICPSFREELWSRLKRMIHSFSNQSVKGFRFNQFLRLAASSSTSMGVNPLSQLQIAIVRSLHRGIPPTHQQWESIIRNNQGRRVCSEAASGIDALYACESFSSSSEVIKHRRSDEGRLIASALRSKEQDGTKRKVWTIVSYLEELLQSGLSEFASVLVGVYIDALMPPIKNSSSCSEDVDAGHKRYASIGDVQSDLDRSCDVGRRASNRRRYKPNTIATWHSRVGDRLVAQIGSASAEEVDSDELDTIFYDIVMMPKTSAEQSRVQSELANVWDRVVDSDPRWPRVEVDFVPSEKCRRVATSLINRQAWIHVTEAIEKLDGLSDIQRASLKYFWHCIYFTGARPSDLVKLRVRDIDPYPESYIRVVNNQYGDGKTTSATRQLPIFILLPSEIRADFLSWVKERHRDALMAPLFIFDVERRLPFSAQSVSKVISALIKAATGISSDSLRGCRHTRASAWSLLAQGNVESVVALDLYSQQHAVEVVAALLGKETGCQHSLYKLCGALGHSSPSPGVLNYFHLERLNVFHTLEHAASPRSAQYWGLISNWSRARITRCENRIVAGGQTIGAGEVREEFITDLRRMKLVKTLRVLQKVDKSSRGMPPHKRPRQKLDRPVYSLAQVHKTVVAILRGTKIPLVCDQEGLPLDAVSGWVNTLNELKLVSTRENTSRLSGETIPQVPAEPHGQYFIPWTPPRPRSQVDCIEAAAIFESVVKRAYLATEQDQIRVGVATYFGHISATSASLRFNLKSDLSKFLRVFKNSGLGLRWRGTIVCGAGTSTSRARSYWGCEGLELCVKPIQRKRGVRHHNGTLCLELLRRGSDRSSAALRWCMPLIAAVICDPEDVSGWC